MKLISAICIESPREVTTKYGQRLVIDCMARDTGEKITLWRGADDDYSRRYTLHGYNLHFLLKDNNIV
jgi:hypothetical protein